MNRLAAIACMLTIYISPTFASAAIHIESYRFEAATEGPTSFFSGTTTLEIDDADIDNKVLAFDLTVGATIFTAADVAITTYFSGLAVVLQSIALGDVGESGGFDNFLLIFTRTAEPSASFAYGQVGYDETFGYGDGYVLVERVATAVPEPASWAMMVAGLAGAAIVLRRGQRRGVARSLKSNHPRRSPGTRATGRTVEIESTAATRDGRSTTVAGRSAASRALSRSSSAIRRLASATRASLSLRTPACASRSAA